MSKNKILKSTVNSEWEGINVKGLIECLESDIYSKNGVVYIHLPESHDCLTAIYTCKVCDDIHFVSGNNTTEDVGNEFNAEFFDHAKQVHKNRIQHEPVQGSITKKELLEFLKIMPEDVLVKMENVKGGQTFLLTEGFKCQDPECTSMHLTVGWENSEDYKK